MTKALYEYSFLVPYVRDDDRTPHGSEPRIENELFKAFNGFSRELGVAGLWKAPNGDEITDANTRYTVAAPFDKQAQLLDIVRLARRWAAQQCIYLRFPDGKVEFVDN